jgi:hypothetical protein
MSGCFRRILTGFAAGVVSVFLIHKIVLAVLHYFAVPGLTMPPALPMDPVPPFGVPRLINLCFWGGLWGAGLAAIWRWERRSYWIGGLCLGLAAVLAGFFIVAPIKGLPIAGNWVITNWIRSLLINGIWGLGVGLILMVVTTGRARDASGET